MHFITLLFMTVLSLIVSSNYYHSHFRQPAVLHAVLFDTEANDDCSRYYMNEQ